MASVIGKDSFTLAEFLDSRDFVLCNKAQYIISGVYLADCECLDNWVFINDFCFGMSFSDFVIKKI